MNAEGKTEAIIGAGMLERLRPTEGSKIDPGLHQSTAHWPDKDMQHSLLRDPILLLEQHGGRLKSRCSDSVQTLRTLSQYSEESFKVSGAFKPICFATPGSH